VNRLVQAYATLSVIAGWIVAFIALCVGAVCLSAYLIDVLLWRAGYGAALIDFAFAESRRSPRKFWGRLFWGNKEEPG
jgi:hypothetical protein